MYEIFEPLSAFHNDKALHWNLKGCRKPGLQQRQVECNVVITILWITDCPLFKPAKYVVQGMGAIGSEYCFILYCSSMRYQL